MISTYSDSINSPFKSFARGASLSAVLIGLFSIVIWLINSDLFYYLLRVSGIVQIDTSFCFILAGTSLFLLNIYPSRRNRNISTACTIVLLAIAAFSICGYLKISDIMCRHIYCFHSKIAPETAIMAPATSMYFLLLGFTFIFLNSRLLTFSAQALSLIGISIGILNLMGHTYGIPALLSIGNYPQTDLLSTMLFLLLMFASLLSHPDKHIVSVITSPYIGGVISRKLLPIALSVPFFLGWLRLMGQKAGFYGLETGIAITGLSSILVFTIIIWGLSNSLNSIDSDRNKAEDISRETNEKLLRMIEDLEEDKKKNALIAEMKDLLQTCTSIPETAPVIKKFVEQLLPSHHGALFLLSPSRNDLEPLVHWGDLEHNPRELIFSPEECWALRRGRPYLMKNPAEEIICPHVKTVPPPLYFCIPLTAYGEVTCEARSSPNLQKKRLKTYPLRKLPRQ